MTETLKQISWITRADDAGISRSHNRAIWDCANSGIIRNVSLMACGPEIRDASQIMAGDSSICFGLHATINSEWNRFRWGPLSNPVDVPSLIEAETGYFYKSPADFLEKKPEPSHIFRELTAQLQRLRDLGFTIRYADTHMMFEWAIESMEEQFDEWCVREGLISHRNYYRDLPQITSIQPTESSFTILKKRLHEAREGQYLSIFHPGIADEETRAWGNEQYPGEQVALDRSQDRQICTNSDIMQFIRRRGIVLARYDEAQPIHSAGDEMI